VTLVIGVGNRARRDDGAGLEVARLLDGVEHEGDALALLELWEGAEDVVLVDAARSGGAPGVVRCFDAIAAPVPTAAVRSSTHALGIADAVELARALGRLPARLRVVAIDGEDFALGQGLTSDVAAAVEAVAATLGRHDGPAAPADASEPAGA